MEFAHDRSSEVSLDRAELGEKFVVARVRPSPIAAEWDRWLEEIGFIPGERVELMARGHPGGDPLAVRVGQSTFALRRAEAACIEVVRADSIPLGNDTDHVISGAPA